MIKNIKLNSNYNDKYNYEIIERTINEIVDGLNKQKPVQINTPFKEATINALKKTILHIIDNCEAADQYNYAQDLQHTINDIKRLCIDIAS